MCSISVEPIPSMISTPKRSSQRSNVCGGSASAADTQKRTESLAPSAPSSRTTRAQDESGPPRPRPPPAPPPPPTHAGGGAQKKNPGGAVLAERGEDRL